MEGLLMFIHIFVCLLLIVIVLLQSGKSADLAGAFGGMGSQATFGPRGRASLLSKMTTTLAILFMVTSLSLWIIAANKSGSQSVLSKEDGKQQQTTPVKKDGVIPPVEQKQEKEATVTPTEAPVTTPADSEKAKTEESKTETPVQTPEGQK